MNYNTRLFLNVLSLILVISCGCRCIAGGKREEAGKKNLSTTSFGFGVGDNENLSNGFIAEVITRDNDVLAIVIHSHNGPVQSILDFQGSALFRGDYQKHLVKPAFLLANKDGKIIAKLEMDLTKKQFDERVKANGKYFQELLSKLRKISTTSNKTNKAETVNPGVK
jgi:hypothetical protein